MVAKLNGHKQAGTTVHVDLPEDFDRLLNDDFEDMFRDGEAINGNTRQVVVPDPDAKQNPDQSVSYTHFESLNDPFRSKVDHLLETNIEMLRGVAANEAGSHPSKMVVSMAAILLSDGTDGQGPHVDQYKSRKAVQLIVYLSDGPGTRMFNTPPDDVIKQASESLQIDINHCRTATRCGALLLPRADLDLYQIPACDVTPGDVWVIPGDRVHSAPPSKGKRAVLFLMFDHKDEFIHYSHDLQLNRLGCLTDCWLEMGPGIPEANRMKACRNISEALCKIGKQEAHEVPWSILANSDYEDIQEIAIELEMYAKSNGKGNWGEASVVQRVQECLCKLIIDESRGMQLPLTIKATLVPPSQNEPSLPWGGHSVGPKGKAKKATSALAPTFEGESKGAKKGETPAGKGKKRAPARKEKKRTPAAALTSVKPARGSRYLYAQSVKAEVKGRNTDASKPELLKLIKEQYDALSDTDRTKFQRLAAKDVKRFNDAVAEFDEESEDEDVSESEEEDDDDDSEYEEEDDEEEPPNKKKKIEPGESSDEEPHEAGTFPTDKQIKKRIRRIVRSADWIAMTVWTYTTVRADAAKFFGVNLDEKKNLIKEVINLTLAALNAE